MANEEQIINLTQHKASAEQVKDGVVDLEDSEILKDFLTFRTKPSSEGIKYRAKAIAMFAVGSKKAMIGGAPYLMAPLEKALQRQGITPVYAFSQRVSEEKEIDGKIIKTQVFKHLGFVEVKMVYERYEELSALLSNLTEDDSESGEYDDEIDEYNEIVTQFPECDWELLDKKSFATKEEAEAYISSAPSVEKTIGDLLVTGRPRGNAEYSGGGTLRSRFHMGAQEYITTGESGSGHWWIRWRRDLVYAVEKREVKNE